MPSLRPKQRALASELNATACKDPSATWYNNADGLNPCEQYQALRQICDSAYQVPVMISNAPPDLCTSQLSGCCCNSVAFNLAMLCLQCQQGVGTGNTGIDAAAGTYQLYLAGCSPSINQSLPDAVQASVCNTGPKLMDFVYSVFRSDGTWFEGLIRDAADLESAPVTPDPGRCNDTSSTTASQSTGSHSTTQSSMASDTTQSYPTSSSSTTVTNATTKGGNSVVVDAVVVSCAVVLAVSSVLVVLFIWMRRRDRRLMQQRLNMVHPNRAALQSQPKSFQTDSRSNRITPFPVPESPGVDALPFTWPRSSHVPTITDPYPTDDPFITPFEPGSPLLQTQPPTGYVSVGASGKRTLADVSGTSAKRVQSVSTPATQLPPYEFGEMESRSSTGAS